VRRMPNHLEPMLVKDLTEAKAALARHGIVILRSIEAELGPAIMAEAKASMYSSPGRLAKLDEDELDRFMEELRVVATRSATDLKELHTRLLSKLGTDYIVELVKELDGIGENFTWERIARAVGPVNGMLDEKGFREIALTGPESVSDNFGLELQERWPPAFVRFKDLAGKAADVLREQAKDADRPRPKKARKG